MDEARRARLRQDWDHDGKVTPNSRMEAEIGEDLEARGLLSGVDRPEKVRGKGDLVDDSGQWWDVKGPKSREAVEDIIRYKNRQKGLPEPSFDPNRRLNGQFDLETEMKNIGKAMGKDRNIILDHRGLSTGDFRALKKAIEQEGNSGRVLWYP